jgi:hypothetical protein
MNLISRVLFRKGIQDLLFLMLSKCIKDFLYAIAAMIVYVIGDFVLQSVTGYNPGKALAVSKILRMAIFSI